MIMTLSVSAIKNGTVIDHIAAGQGLKIMRILQLTGYQNRMTLGLNLPSSSLVKKDLIKVEDLDMSLENVGPVAVFAPQATMNIIDNYTVIKKFQVAVPNLLSSIFTCPNSRCVSNHEPMESLFHVHMYKPDICLQCRYCRRLFPYHEVQVK